MKSRIVLLLAGLFVFCISFSMPPRSDVAEKIRSGEIAAPRFREGMNGNFTAETAPRGSFRAVVLLMDFNDQPAQVNTSFFEDLLNGQGIDFQQKYPVSTNHLSVKEYYALSSDGGYEITFDVYGWYRAQEDYSYYVGGTTDYGLGMYPNNAQRLTEEAVEAADADVDFSLYDNDGNGSVDFLLVVHTGSGPEFTGTGYGIWSHQWSISAKQKDGKSISRYSMQPEYWLQPYDMTVGVYAHELGHLLFGLPDLYDTSYNSRGIGYWGLMGSGSWNDEMSVYGPSEISGYGGAPADFTAWSKQRIGWIEPLNVASWDGTFGLPAGTVWKYANPEKAAEYFLVEFLAPDVQNEYLPSDNGLMILHVDDDKYSNNQPWTPGTNPDYHYRVAVMQKDGLWELEQYINRGTVEDLFFAGDFFTPLGGQVNRTLYNVPQSRFYDGTAAISIAQIQVNGTTASITLEKSVFDVYFHVAPINGKVHVFVRNADDSLPVLSGSVTPIPSVTRFREGLYGFVVEPNQVDLLSINGTPLRNWIPAS
ncbi:MAG TPA: M6 family metalloprotease domain-containing protein [Thermotogota bacterium]|nr:M6 family metalloprotease domain-containing protein [Thermotogota bacterium]